MGTLVQDKSVKIYGRDGRTSFEFKSKDKKAQAMINALLWEHVEKGSGLTLATTCPHPQARPLFTQGGNILYAIPPGLN